MSAVVTVDSCACPYFSKLVDKRNESAHTKRMRVAAYFRVSTGAQAGEDRFGLQAQHEAVERYCAEHHHEIVAVYEDAGYSGASADRPELARMLHEAAHEGDDGRKPPFDAVVVAKGDRIARDVMLDGYLRFTLKKAGVEIISASEETTGNDPTTQLMQAMLAAFAQFERSLITARLVGGRRVKRAAGGYAEGRPRFGTRAVGKALVANEDEARAVALIRKLRKRGMTIRAIAAHLNETQFRPRHAKKWNPSTVGNIVQRLSHS